MAGSVGTSLTLDLLCADHGDASQRSVTIHAVGSEPQWFLGGSRPILGPDGRPVNLQGHLPRRPALLNAAPLASGGSWNSSGGTWNSPGAFPCQQCGKVYRWKGNLSLHLRQECGKPPQFQCPHCPHRSKQKSNLKTHMLNIHGQQFKDQDPSQLNPPQVNKDRETT